MKTQLILPEAAVAYDAFKMTEEGKGTKLDGFYTRPTSLSENNMESKK
jgi:hypothetical protein